jgi:ribosomal protein S18 acetylase RimI-like enzyme
VASDLVEALMAGARADGYRELRLDTTNFLDAAVQLYRKHGFEDSPHRIDIPDEAMVVVMFLRRML